MERQGRGGLNCRTSGVRIPGVSCTPGWNLFTRLLAAGLAGRLSQPSPVSVTTWPPLWVGLCLIRPTVEPLPIQVTGSGRAQTRRAPGGRGRGHQPLHSGTLVLLDLYWVANFFFKKTKLLGGLTAMSSGGPAVLCDSGEQCPPPPVALPPAPLSGEHPLPTGRCQTCELGFAEGKGLPGWPGPVSPGPHLSCGCRAIGHFLIIMFKIIIITIARTPAIGLAAHSPPE